MGTMLLTTFSTPVIKIKKILFAVCICVLLFSANTNAAMVTISGALNNSDFDLTFDDAMLGLFGTPMLSNNQISFTPTSFIALSANGGGFVTTPSTISLILTPLDPVNVFITAFDLTETGDYRRLGMGTSVMANGQLRASNVGMAAQESTDFIEETAPFNVENALTNWSALASIDEMTGDWQPTGDPVSLIIENLLTAFTEVNGLNEAFIEKKRVIVDVQVVPLPPAVLLFAIGLFGAGFFARRRI